MEGGFRLNWQKNYCKRHAGRICRGGVVNVLWLRRVSIEEGTFLL